MFKIGEFSKLTQVSVRMLRYYDKAGLLTPAHTDPYTGYRLYAAGQITDLNRILFLRDTGFQVAEIADALRHWDNSSIESHLSRKRAEIQSTIQQEQDKLAKIAQAARDLQQNQIAIHTNVIIKQIPSYFVLSYRKHLPNYYAEGEMWHDLAAIPDLNLSHDAETFTIYHDIEYKEENIDVELCIKRTNPSINSRTSPSPNPTTISLTNPLPNPTQHSSTGVLTYCYTAPVPLMATTMVTGSFYHIAAAFHNFAHWLEHHTQYQMAGTSRQIVHRGPWNEPDPTQYLTEIQIPLLTLTPCQGLN